MTSKTICITQEGPANALALNKDNSQVVIAGRNGAFIYSFFLSKIFFFRKIDVISIVMI